MSEVKNQILTIQLHFMHLCTQKQRSGAIARASYLHGRLLTHSDMH